MTTPAPRLEEIGRKKFAQQEDEWKTALCHRLSAEAVRDLPATKDVT